MAVKGNFDQVDFTAGNVVEFRITDTEFCYYTLSAFDKEKGFCEVISYLHKKGIGYHCANTLKTGNDVKQIGSGGPLKYNPEYGQHVVFGDETCI